MDGGGWRYPGPLVRKGPLGGEPGRLTTDRCGSTRLSGEVGRWAPRRLTRFSGGFAAQRGGAAVVLVEAVEDGVGDGHGAGVVSGHGQAAQDDVEAWGFGSVEAFVVDVGFVDDLTDAAQGGVVGEMVDARDGFEAAVAVVVAEFGAAYVEGGRVGGDVGWVGDEDKLGRRVDEATDQPGAGGAVDVDARAGGPLRAVLSSVMLAGCRALRACSAVPRSAGGK